MANFSSTYPATKPVFQADFANGGRIDPRATFSRADTASSGNWSAATNSPGLADGSGTANQYYRVSAAGVQDLGSGSISFEVGDYIKYSGSVWFKTTQPISVTYWSNEKHLSSQNLLLQSSDFDTTWTANDVTRTSTASGGPDSSSAAFLVYPNTNSSNARVYQSLTVSSGERGVLSVYAKQAGKTILAIVEQIGTGSLQYSYFDLTDGSDSGSSNHTRTATASGNGYYRCSIALTPNASRSGNVYFYVVDAAGSVTATANGTDGIYLFGSQYEALASGGPTALNATTTQIARSYAPTLKSVATAGAARFEYDPTDGQSGAKGLLLESASTNLFTYSSDASNAAWTKTGTTATAEAIGPDGQLSAFAVRETTATSVHILRQAATIGSGSVAFSIYAKLLGNTRRLVLREDSTTGAYATFDLTAGTVAASGAGGSGSIEAVGNGFYRCTMVSSPGADTKNFSAWVVQSTATTYETYTGDGYSGLLLAMPQIENQSFSSSWISTTSSTATRAADSLSVPTADIGYTGGPVSVVAEASMQNPVANSNNRAVLELRQSGSTANRLLLYNYGGRADGVYAVADGSSTALFSGTINTDAYFKTSVSMDTNSITRSVNGGAITEDTSGQLPSNLDTLSIGCGNSVNPLDGHIKRVALYSEALSDTNLQALTS